VSFGHIEPPGCLSAVYEGSKDFYTSMQKSTSGTERRYVRISVEGETGIVKDLADFCAAREQLSTGRIDVGDGQDEALC